MGARTRDKNREAQEEKNISDTETLVSQNLEAMISSQKG
jgi:hypothetical protein